MADATVTPPAPRRRRRWLRFLAWGLGTLIVLVLVVYFVATSSAFFKGVILPKVSKAINADVTVSDASISPFKQVILHNLKVQPAGAEPLVTAPEIRLRYSLMDIIGGNIHVDEVALSSPTIVLIENPDGSRNIDPILKSQQQQQKAPPKEKPAPSNKPSKPAQIDLKQLSVTGATIRYVKLYKNGNRDVDELSNVNLNLANVGNGQTGKLTLAAAIAAQLNPPPPGTNGVLQGRLNGDFTFALTADLKPGSVKGNTHFEVTRAEGALAQAAELGTDLDCDVTPTDIKQVALRFQKGATPLGQVRAAGPFDMEKTEGRLLVEVQGIDKQLLNVAGAAAGIDFGSTAISSTNLIQLAKSGSVITAGGQLSVNRLQVTRAAQTTPVLDFRTDYDVTVDRTQTNALIRGFTMNGTQQGKQLLQGGLTSPMLIPLGNTTGAIGDSTFDLNLAGLDLADWKPFLGDMASSGLVNAKVKVVSTQGGQHQTFDVNSAINNLSAAFGSNRVNQATITLLVNGQASKFKQIDLSQCKFQVSRQDQPLLTASASGNYNLDSKNADLQLALQAFLARLLEVAPQPNLTVSSGTAELKSHVTQQQNAQTVTGSFALGDFSAAFGTNELRRLGLTADYDVTMAGSQAQIRKLAGQLTADAKRSADFSVSGTFNTTNQDADLDLNLQAVLAPLVQLMPQPNVSVSSGTAGLKGHMTQKQKTGSVTGNFSLADFTGHFGSNAFSSYSVTADLDVGMTPQQIKINKLAGKLAQGANPGGAFDLTGTYNTNKSALLTAKLAGFNQNGLRPFLQPMLADKTLVSVALNGNADVQYDPQGSSAFKAGLQVTNLVVNDPKQQIPAKPLEAKMQLDAGLQKQVLDLRQCQVALTPTDRGSNQVQLTGRVDMTDTNAIQGNLKLLADSLDLTTYYDLFTGQNKAATTTSAPAKSKAPAAASTKTAPPATASTNPAQEPAPVKLPVRNFTAEANIRRLYLREIQIADWQTTSKIDVSHVAVNPFKLTLNGAPMNSTVDLDLSVPGYKYDVVFNAQAIPLAPLVNTFQPEKKGVLSGTLTAQANIGGTGTTGASLKENLKGQFDLNSTNLNLSVDNIPADNIYTRLLKMLVTTIGAIPDLAKNPAGTATSLLQGFTGGGGANAGGNASGLAADLKKSPINAIILRGTAGSGQVALQQAVIQSPAFEAVASGTVTLNDVLTNSTLNIPIAISLERAIAQRINMAGNTPANATYAKLPDFYAFKGTLGDPKQDINKLALASAVLQGVGGKAGQVGGMLQGLGGILPGGGNTNKPAAGTNQPGGGKLGGVLQGLGGVLGNPPPGTNAPATNQSPAGNLLNNLFGPKKK